MQHKGRYEREKAVNEELKMQSLIKGTDSWRLNGEQRCQEELLKPFHLH